MMKNKQGLITQKMERLPGKENV